MRHQHVLVRERALAFLRLRVLRLRDRRGGRRRFDGLYLAARVGRRPPSRVRSRGGVLALPAAVPTTWGAGGLAGCEILTAGARARLERYSGRGLNSGLNSGRRDVNFALACGEQLCEFGLHSTPHAVLAIKRRTHSSQRDPWRPPHKSAHRLRRHGCQKHTGSSDQQ